MEQLRDRGTLTPEEFERAKKRVLEGGGAAKAGSSFDHSPSLGKAAAEWVEWHKTMSIVGLVIFGLFAVFIFAMAADSRQPKKNHGMQFQVSPEAGQQLLEQLKDKRD